MLRPAQGWPGLLLLLVPVLALHSNPGITFTQSPESRVAPPGDWVFFNCKTNIGKGQRIRWLHNGVLLDPAQRSDIKISNGQLSIKVRNSRGKRDRQRGRYQCVAGAAGQFLLSLPATLTVARLDTQDTQEVKEVAASEGNTVIFSAELNLLKILKSYFC